MDEDGIWNVLPDVTLLKQEDHIFKKKKKG
jgi:hypothetical protein